MNIGVDLRLFAEGRQSGVEEYTESILQNLLEIDQKNTYRLFFNAYKAKEGEQRVRAFEKYSNVELTILNLPNKMLNASFHLRKRPYLDELVGGADVWFSPNIIFSSLSRHVKKVLTVHDLSFEIYPEFLSLKRKLWHRAVDPKKQIESCSKIIAVSHATKDDLVNYYNIDSERITVIHSGLRKTRELNDATIDLKDTFNIHSPYFLFFATLEPRKNADALLRAYDQFRVSNSERIQLVLAGASGWLDKGIRQFINESQYADDIVLTGPVSEEEKTTLYKNAIVLLYPSLYEGFGFPPLEAMQLDIPVITSAASSLPEVVGKNAILVDPYSISDIEAAMRSITTSESLRAEYIKRGRSHHEVFQWREAAEKTHNTLTQIQ